MVKEIVLPAVGFTLAVVVGFVVGKEVRKATQSNVDASLSGSTVIIKADLKQIARQSLSESKLTIIDSISGFFK